MSARARQGPRRHEAGAVMGAAIAAALVAAAPPVAAATLDCLAGSSLNWRVQPPLVLPHEDEDGTLTIHLDPAHGRYFIANSMSRALVIGGGTFTIVRTGFAGYADEWVGVDYGAMLRIYGNVSPYPFVFLSRDYALTGRCAEPEEPFLLLGDVP